MPGSHKHKIDHSCPWSRADPTDSSRPWKVKACRYTPETRAEIFSICLICLSIDGDLSIKSPGRPHRHLTVNSPEIGFVSVIFTFRTLEDLKLSSIRGFVCYWWILPNGCFIVVNQLAQWGLAKRNLIYVMRSA